MASRRTRIKGIANIPQRRKGPGGPSTDKLNKPISVKEEKDEVPEIKNEIKEETINAEVEFQDNKRLDSYLNDDEISPLTSIVSSSVDEKKLAEIDKEDTNKNLNIQNKEEKEQHTSNISTFDNESSLEQLEPTKKPPKIDKQESEISKTVSSHDYETKNTDKKVDKPSTDDELLLNVQSESDDEVKQATSVKLSPEVKKTQPNAIRRKFLKPNVNSVVFNKRPVKEQPDKKIIVLEQLVIPPQAPTVTQPQSSSAETSCNIVKLPTPSHTPPPPLITPSRGVECTLPETVFPVPRDSPSPRVRTTSEVGHGSDLEYPPPPPSPTKLNRSRIKAVPRLHQRKTSFSASESEDESKRHGRIRNDSVCSVASGINEGNTPIPECPSPQKCQTPSAVPPQKKINRNEQSRKIAEARREFQRKFGSKNPDKGKLRMIDLIFYNPVTNPMNKDKDKKKKGEEEEEKIDKESEEEKVDNPDEGKEEQEEEISEVRKDSDEENEMPVPQIKIGPSGEIILDEKSLVVENKEVKRQKEQIQKSVVVNGDFDTGYGIYKKVKRAKEWYQRETLRFYKALNVIGTDFSLMVDLFPGRNRRELKMKFKKEERINRSLIDKAIMEPCQYNYNELKREVEQDEKEYAELKKIKEENAKKRAENNTRKRKAKSESKKKEAPPESQPTVAKKPKLKPLSINSILDDSDADVSDIETQSDSDEEVSICLKPTRSGRIPKVTQKYDEVMDEAEAVVPINLISVAPLPDRYKVVALQNNMENTSSSPKKNKLEPMEISNLRRASVVSNQDQVQNLEPGSTVVLQEEDETGKKVYKLYMVTQSELTPIDIDPETLSGAINGGLTINSTEDHQEIIIEENVTISEDETENLRSGEILGI